MEQDILRVVPLTSLHKVFPEGELTSARKDMFTSLKNEPLSVQVAYRLHDFAEERLPLNVKIQSDLPISLYSVGYVPVPHAEVTGLSYGYQPGLFPDILLPKKVNPKTRKLNSFLKVYAEEGEKIVLHAAKDCWKSIWLTIGEREKCKAGNHTVKVIFCSRLDDTVVAECDIQVKIIDANLPKQTLKYTNWLYCDSIADTHNVELFSDRFFEILGNYMQMASLNGMNTVLTPCFTPPLDTAIGDYRKTVQLVKVTYEDGKYSFDFSLLKRFIDVAKKNGIAFFEHNHLFTQWGAEYAPQIVATVKGRQKRIFGWDTKAGGAKYTKFLRAYLPALITFLKAEGVDKKFLYHISDEPSLKHLKGYATAKKALGVFLDNYIMIDALSDYELYKRGLVQTPVVSTTRVQDFKGRCKNYWCYYTGGEIQEGQSNRFLVCTNERNRMIGLQMYTGRVKGFLHWAYNSYYDILSQGLFNPCIDADGYGGRAAGTTYFVYPSPDGTVLQSIRQKIFYEGINDMRALLLLERLKGKRFVNELIEKHYGEVTFFTPAGSEEKLIAFREAVNECIEKAL